MHDFEIVIITMINCYWHKHTHTYIYDPLNSIYMVIILVFDDEVCITIHDFQYFAYKFYDMYVYGYG